jgi:cation:H+ antiporter
MSAVSILWFLLLVAGVGLIVWGAEQFAEHLSDAAARLGVGAFALALLLAGAEPEELATVVVASLRNAPGIAFGDIIGANVAMCLVALGLGAVLMPLRFTTRVMLYALAAVPISAVSLVLIWDGQLSRIEGLVLIGMYVLYVGAIWFFERAPPVLGEVEELIEAEEELAEPSPHPARGRVGIDLVFVVLGVAAMAAGGTALVEAIRRITNIEDTQTNLGLTIVGFATAFELVVLVWSASKRDATDVALAGIVGSFGYNMTMSLGVGALVKPLRLSNATGVRVPAVIMLATLIGVIALAMPSRRLGRPIGVALLGCYPLFVLFVLLR